MTTTIPFTVLSFNNKTGFHLSLKLLINGKTAHLILDTGASSTVFDKKRITKLVGVKNLNKNKNAIRGIGKKMMDLHTTIFKKIKIGDITIKDYKANLIDLSHVNAAYAATGIPTIDGVLGNDILYNYNAVINYKKATLKLTEKTIKKSTAKKILKLTSKKAKK